MNGVSAERAEAAPRRRVIHVGFKAHRALQRHGGLAGPLPGFAKSSYLRAGSEIIWIGSRGGTMHPRSVLIDAPMKVDGGVQFFDLAGCSPWHPGQPSLAGEKTAMLAARCRQLAADIERVGMPVGFGLLLIGRTPDFPLDRAAGHARSLAAACLRNDPAAAYDCALPLLGVGPGLTPSGDDFVAAALFGRRLATEHTESAARWNDVATRLTAAAGRRSNAISAALFADTAAGCSFAPIHRLAAALASDTAWNDVIAAAGATVKIGHSSGWDMLAGLIAGVTGTAGPVIK